MMPAMPVIHDGYRVSAVIVVSMGIMTVMVIGFRGVFGELAAGGTAAR